MPAKTRRKYEGNAVATTITSNLGNAVGDTSISVTAATGWPSSGPFYVVIDPGTASEEKMLVGTISGTALSSITRGVDGTTRVSHASGAAIYPVFTAVDADEANELTAKYTTRGDIVYQGASTFETLAKGTANHVLKQGANDPAWGYVTNDNVDASAAIVDTKLATISTANKVSVAALDIDGATDIGADLADADLVIVDDGAGGTNRKSAISRFAKYLFGKVSGDITVTDAGVAAIGSGVIVNADVNASAGIAFSKLETAVSGAWITTHTPTYVGMGVSSTTFRYIQLGKTVHFFMEATFDVNGITSGTHTISLPVAASTQSSLTGLNAVLTNFTADRYLCSTVAVSTSTIRIHYQNPLTGTFDAVDGSNPFDTSTSDTLIVSGTYQAA